jgi:hypothetical protein
LLGIEAAASALNVPVVAPDATVIDAGTFNRALLLDRVTAEPPAGATCDSVTVHVLTPDCPRFDGLHPRPEITAATKLIAAVCWLLPKVALTVAL